MELLWRRTELQQRERQRSCRSHWELEWKLEIATSLLCFVWSRWIWSSQGRWGKSEATSKMAAYSLNFLVIQWINVCVASAFTEQRRTNSRGEVSWFLLHYRRTGHSCKQLYVRATQTDSAYYQTTQEVVDVLRFISSTPCLRSSWMAHGCQLFCGQSVLCKKCFCFHKCNSFERD